MPCKKSLPKLVCVGGTAEALLPTWVGLFGTWTSFNWLVMHDVSGVRGDVTHPF